MWFGGGGGKETVGKCTQINRKLGEGEGEDKVVREEGGATEGLINHAQIVIDFLLKALRQTLNYVFVRMRCSFESRKSSIAAALSKCSRSTSVLNL